MDDAAKKEKELKEQNKRDILEWMGLTDHLLHKVNILIEEEEKPTADHKIKALDILTSASVDVDRYLNMSKDLGDEELHKRAKDIIKEIDRLKDKLGAIKVEIIEEDKSSMTDKVKKTVGVVTEKVKDSARSAKESIAEDCRKEELYRNPYYTCTIGVFLFIVGLLIGWAIGND